MCRLAAVMTVKAHPYFPLDLQLPGYVPMQVDFDYILGVFFTAVLLVFGLTWKLAGEVHITASVQQFVN
jgi:cholestenol delta-isomerase